MIPETAALLLRTLQLRNGIAGDVARREWAGADVRGLSRVVGFNGAEVWLYRRLRALDASPPAEFLVALREAAQRVAVLALRVDAQTAAVLGLFARAGIPCSLIKGQARRAAARLYPYADARGVADVDLLLPEGAAQEAWELLRNNRYEPCYPGPTPWKVSHHLTAIWDENRVAVELHTTTSDRVAASEAWRRASEDSELVTWNGGSLPIPGPTELLWQALAHAVEDGPKGYRLCSFLNVAAILAENPPIRWSVVEDRIAAGEVWDPEHNRPMPAARLIGWLATAAELAGTPLPLGLGRGEGIDLERFLRWQEKILRSRLGASARDRLLEEGARSEARMPLSPAVKGTGALLRVRRRTASLAARILYSTWKATTSASSSASENPSG